MDNVEHLPHPVNPTPPEFAFSLHMVHVGAGHSWNSLLRSGGPERS